MGAANKICPYCGKKMKQQFIGLQHCACGTSWKKDIGFFQRSSNMVFSLSRVMRNGKIKQVPASNTKNRITTDL